jgi:stage V sporulation protein R
MTKTRNRLLFTDNEWTFDRLHNVAGICEDIATKELKLDLYPNQIEIISSEQMLDAYASIGMPVMYKHWSWGKSFLQNEHSYRKGLQGLAYEIVINSNPCINYLMEENTMTMQTLVIAHAACGHNSFFKSNELFRQWTDADGIIDYLVFARDYIDGCEERYGSEAVEETLDHCHALMSYGVDRYRRPGKLNVKQEKEKQEQRDQYIQSTLNDLWRTLPPSSTDSTPDDKTLQERQKLLNLPEENILYFIEKKAPLLKPWQREIIRIVRKISQYLYPQKQTKVGNEGWATFTHYYIMNRLKELGYISDASMLEFLHSHTNVVRQVGFDHPGYTGFNPYALGFELFQDIRRICENPTNEDREWFPDLAGEDWVEALNHAMRNFRDESLIRQYLSPHLIRKLRLFSIQDNKEDPNYIVRNIHNEQGYRDIRTSLANQYNISELEPDIQVYDVDLNRDRRLYIRHTVRNGRPLNNQTERVLKHLRALWGYDVVLESVDLQSGKTITTVSVK